ncbi:hypothetical protein PMNALOAF_4380 [Methylobacterium adhaesivum]|uniref:Uncharacterized protein n=1 Tax=Methylobacterium adhaesivum TaxID=333297 RepID=A0ABT8BGC4_9HYPH|nr:hypothetical protein [Methylobacterium adhaesivum]MDN3590585.1 hypothetical protein [Methylobacterium adhaesivum]GJD33099.1 hypothetical protein PMNALOAF_4380 [Methylobacterium adhaesivum]
MTVATIIPLPPLNILVERAPGAVIPETGTTGQAMRESLLSLTLGLTGGMEAVARAAGQVDRSTIKVHESSAVV